MAHDDPAGRAIVGAVLGGIAGLCVWLWTRFKKKKEAGIDNREKIEEPEVKSWPKNWIWWLAGVGFLLMMVFLLVQPKSFLPPDAVKPLGHPGKAPQVEKKAQAASAASSLVDNWMEEGSRQSYEGNHSQAIFFYTKAINSNSQYEEAYISRARCYKELGRHNEAIQDYSKTIELNPKRYVAFIERASLYEIIGNHEKSMEDYNKAIETGPEYSNGYYNRGLAYLKLKNYQQAMEDINKGIEVSSPSDLHSLFNARGETYMKLGKYKQALQDFDKAITALRHSWDSILEAKEPIRSRTYLRNRGFAYAKLGKKQQAISDLKKAAKQGDKEAQKFLLLQGMDWENTHQ